MLGGRADVEFAGDDVGDEAGAVFAHEVGLATGGVDGGVDGGGGSVEVGGDSFLLCTWRYGEMEI